MPELPDIIVYLEALERRVLDQPLQQIRLASPFLVRTTMPSITSSYGKTVRKLRRIGKRIAFGLDEDLWLVLHLMIAGRLHWRERGAKLTRKLGLAAFDFPTGSLLLTEAGSKKRASLHVVQGENNLRELDPGGLEVLDSTPESFSKALRIENHTLKRALTDPTLFSGIGNAYSDEILHRAHLSPVALTQRLTDEEVDRLHHATRECLSRWIEVLRKEAGDSFPQNVTAFRTQMAVHGKFGQACPTCGAQVQRIRYAENETNYCPTCQTGGKLLADRALSQLLRKDWPKTPEAMEEMRSAHRR